MNDDLILDDMVKIAGDHARNVLIENKDNLMPAFLFQNGAGAIGFIPLLFDMTNVRLKNAMADAARGIMRAEGAVAYVFVSEAWLAVLKVGEALPNRVSERPDKIEVVYASAYDDAGNERMTYWRMRRGPDGKVEALIEELSHSGLGGAGRFANLLVTVQ